MTSIESPSKPKSTCVQANKRAFHSSLRSEGAHSSDVIINILARQRDPGPVASVSPEALRLRDATVADCARYDQFRSA
jgi:hypothetical protein